MIKSCVLSFPSGEVPTGTYRLCIVNQLRDDSNGTLVISLGILILYSLMLPPQSI